MNPNNENVTAAPGAAEWNERMAHESVMKMLSKIRGYRFTDYGDNVYGGGPYVTWVEDKPSLEELEEIMACGRHDEIMYMIERYNNAVSLEDQKRENCPAYFSLPEEIQETLASRGNQEEINAYLSVQGFGAKGQDVILARGDHDEILNYVSKHGLLAEQQRKLLARDNKEEIVMHISRHGLADELINEMIDDVYFDRDLRLFNLFVQHHELPVFAQKRMVKILPKDVVIGYINRYGLWNEAHVDLVQSQSKDTVIAYLERHHYLCPEAEDALARYPDLTVRQELLRAYVRCWKNAHFNSNDHFLSALLQEPEANRDIISHVLLNMPYTEGFLRMESEQDTALIKNGSDEALEARINEGKLLHIRALSELFFERESKFFTDYVAKCPLGNYYLC